MLRTPPAVVRRRLAFIGEPRFRCNLLPSTRGIQHPFVHPIPAFPNTHGTQHLSLTLTFVWWLKLISNLFNTVHLWLALAASLSVRGSARKRAMTLLNESEYETNAVIVFMSLA